MVKDLDIYYCLILNNEDETPKPVELISLSLARSSEKTNLVKKSFIDYIHGRSFMVAGSYQNLLVLGLFGLLVGSQPQNPSKQSKTELYSRMQGATEDWIEVLSESWIMVSPTETFASIRENFPEPSSSVLLIAHCELNKRVVSELGVIEGKTGRRRNRSKTVYNDDNVANAIIQKALSPSAGAKNEMMMKTQHPDLAGAIYNGRPSCLTGPSINIYHPVFSKFQIEFAKVPLPGQVPAKDLLFANKFVENSLRYYSSKVARQNVLAPTINYFLGSETLIEKGFFCGDTKYTPDGSKFVWITCNEEEVIRAFVFLGELKNGLGLGDCDPMDQAEKTYLLGCVEPEIAPLRRNSCMPTFLLAIAGPHIMVSGAIYLNRVVSQRLTDFISLVPPLMAHSMVYQSEHDFLVHRIAHLFRTLRRCMDVLEDEYTRMSLPVRPVEDVLSHRISHLLNHRAVFSADVQTSSGETIDCIVKFAPRYCGAAHRLMYDMGVTPRLLYCNFEPSVGKVCIVMECIKEQETTGRPQVSESGFNKLSQALSELHKNSYVFGDLRDVNIIVDPNGWLYLVDFDWSGKQGEVTYPTNINMDISWAKDVRCGRLIEAKHDIEMLELYRKEIDIV